MTEKQIELIRKYYSGKLVKENLFKEFGNEILEIKFVKEEIRKSFLSKNSDNTNRAISLIWFQEDYEPFIDELNMLLLDPYHTSHQVITKTIQDLKNPTSIPFIRKALKTRCDC